MRGLEMTSLMSALLDLLFPPRCPFCRRLLASGEKGLCARCQTALPWLEGAAAEQKGEFFARCISPLRYEGDVRASIHRYKFSGAQGYAKSYAALMAQCVCDHEAGACDLVTWAPLSPKRRRERGYDQARLLAQAMAAELGLPVGETLRKCRHTQAQSGLEGAAERRANVLGAYELLPGAGVAEKRILLVDDVVTSAATLSECARILRTAGAKDVTCVTLARAR